VSGRHPLKGPSVMRYAVLLRAINLRSYNRVSMPDLRALLADLGHADVRTHLQSGNAVITSQLSSARDLEVEIAAAIADRLKVSCAVMVRTGAELAATVREHPLETEPENPARYFVAFLSAQPSAQRAAALAAQSFEPDQIWLRGREAYFWCPAGPLQSRITNVGLEKLLGVSATSRNWNTVTKLASLTGAAR
jgi:uncharacterized protein (DUF1697 family)